MRSDRDGVTAIALIEWTADSGKLGIEVSTGGLEYGPTPAAELSPRLAVGVRDGTDTSSSERAL